jgi:hypothetical protein
LAGSHGDGGSKGFPNLYYFNVGHELAIFSDTPSAGKVAAASTSLEVFLRNVKMVEVGGNL